MEQQRVLSGEVLLEVDKGIEDLRDQVSRLSQENRVLANKLIRAEADAQQATMAITALRSQLGPLHRAMKAVFGEIDMVIPEEQPYEAATQSASGSGTAGTTPTARMDKWEAIMKRVGGRDAKVIEVLLTMGPKNNTQLSSLVRCHYTKAAEATRKLASLGFIEKQGELWALKD